MNLREITLIRPGMGNYQASDGLQPLSMAILAARTPDDIQVNFYDDKIESLPADDHPDLVAMTVETFTARRAYTIAKRYREKGVPVVMGGYHPSFLPDEVKMHADAIVTGDAEGVWEQLLEDARNNRLKKHYHGDNTRSLDDFTIDRSLFKGKKYPPVELVQYGRGCRFTCDFCSIRAFYKSSLRQRNIDSLLAELESLKKNRLIFFVDDNLFNSRQALQTFLDAIKPLGIKWSCQISIDVAKNDALLDDMAQAGCVLALIGFESLSPNNLRQMGKPWNKVAGDYIDVVKKFHQRGIAVYGTFVFGYDWDRIDTIERSLAFALEAKLEIANFNPLTPTPGSALYNRLRDTNRLIFPEWWLDPDYRYGDSIFEPERISADDLAWHCYQAKKKFYSWRSIASRVLGSDAGLQWFRTGMVGLANIISRREVKRKQYRVLGS